MQYQIPPDVLHYEPRLFLGLTAQDMMVIGMAAIFGIQKFGILGGVLSALLAFGAAVRFSRFGNRSVLVYLGLSLFHRYRPQAIVMPRVLPDGGEVRMTLYDLDGQEQIRFG